MECSRLVLCGDDVEYWLNGVNVVSYRLQSPEWEVARGRQQVQGHA